MKKSLKFLIPLVLCFSFGALRVLAEEVDNNSYSDVISEFSEECVIDDKASLEFFLDTSPKDSMIVYFDHLSVDRDITLPKGDYTLRGVVSFTNGSMTIGEGSRISLDGCDLTFSNGGIVLKGTAYFDDCRISSPGNTVLTLDSQDANAGLNDSVFTSMTAKYPTLNILRGECSIIDSDLSNSSGICVSSDDRLYIEGKSSIAGVGFDIMVTKPFYLLNELSSTLRIKYNGSFEKGAFTAIVGVSSVEVYRDIEIYDKDSIRYSFEYSLCDGNYFLGVSLPYKVRFYKMDGSIETKELFKGDKIIPPESGGTFGYTFDGWYYDEEGRVKFRDGDVANGDIVLYERYSLISPNFSLSSLEFTYDGKYHILSFTELYHPFDDKGFYTFEWYKNGVLVSTGRELRLKFVSDSGIYSSKITFFYGADSVSCYAENIDVTIKPQTVSPPTIESAVYTGKEITPEIGESNYYCFDKVSFIDVGEYYVTVYLNDPDNTIFDGGYTESYDVPFKILKAENRWIVTPSISDAFLIEKISPIARALFGEVRFLFSDGINKPYRDKVPDKSGVYYMKAYVQETENYYGLLSEPIEFSIVEENIISLKIETYPEKTDYVAFDQFLSDGLTLRAVYDSGREEVISGRDVSFSYQRGESLRVGDSGVVISYKGISLLLPIKVERREYDLSSISKEDVLKVYNGKYQTLDTPLPSIIGEDGIALEITVIGGNTDAGEHRITLSFSTESRDYLTPPDLNLNMIIFPLIVDIVWEELSFVYDGGLKVPIAYYIDESGNKIYPEVIGGASEAGENYIAYVLSDNKNYELKNTTVKFTVQKADYDFSGIVWSDDRFIYDGEKKNIFIYGLPEGVEAIGYTNNLATNAGKYTVTVSLSYDKKNYNAPKTLSHTWEILRAEYDLSGFEFCDKEYVFDGKEHYPRLVGSMPMGKDGIMLEYYFSDGVIHVSEGEASVMVYFKTASQNYNLPENMSAKVSILPRGITVSWDGEDIYYTGNELLPSAFCPECEVSVFGGGVNAGCYTAIANSLDTDYYIVNSSFEYEIKKSKNSWVTSPTSETSYEGRTPRIFGTLLYGEMVCVYYSDADCKNEVTPPLLKGKYFVIVKSNETANYFAAEEVVLELDVIEIKPLVLEIELLREGFVAFETVGLSDFSAYYVNNDGSRQEVDAKLVNVIYENGDTLLKKDFFIEFECGGLKKKIPISVGFADYDLSLISWEGTRSTYDGQPKTPTLVGLPSGILIVEYLGAGEIGAGEYSVRAVVDYDSENYNSPNIPACTLIIEKAVIDYPFLTGVYSGGVEFPKFDSELYTLFPIAEYINVGSYYVGIRLNDPQNYRFSDTDESVSSVSYKIFPMTVYVAIKDVTLHLFEKLSDIEMSVSEPSTVDIDELGLNYYEKEGFIYLESENENYKISYSPVKVTRLSFPREEVSRGIIIGFLAMLLAILLALVYYVQKHRILSLYAIIKCRWHNRKLCVYPPKSGTASEGENGRINEDGVINEKCPDKGEEDEIVLPDEEFTSTENEPEEDIIQDDELFTDEYKLTVFSVDKSRADALISDSLAKNLLTKEDSLIYTSGYDKRTISLGEVNACFKSGERVDANILKERALIPETCAYIKITEEGIIDKPLTVYANEFTLTAVKMIALSGGEAIKCITLTDPKDENNIN